MTTGELTGKTTYYRSLVCNYLYTATRRILITSEEELEPYPTAVRILHWGNDYVLQFGTAEETREAYEALKNSPLSDFVELDAVLTLDD